MNVLPPDKQRWLYRLFAYGHGLRESARIAGVNRGTAARYRRVWTDLKPKLQEAYDLLHNGECEKYDAIMETVPTQVAIAVGIAWQDDQFDQTKSKFWTWE